MYNKSSQSSQNQQKVPLETSLPHNAERQLPSISPPTHTPIPEKEVELTPAQSVFQSNRSRTLPPSQASDTQPVIATYTPLSERDSIFATTYSSSPPTHSDPIDPVNVHDGAASQSSPAQSLEAHRLTGLGNNTYTPGQTPLVVNQRAHPVARPAKRRSPATSYFDPSDQIRSRLLANTRHNLNMATLDESRRETSTFNSSPLDSPSSERPTTSSSASSALQFIESEADKEERSRYRLWRQGQGAMEGRLLYGGKMRSGDRTRVDKKIEATLPKADAGNAAARSRKASQYLGLFRENEAEEEQKRVNDDSREGRSPGRDRSKSGRASRRQTPRGDAGPENDYFGKYNFGQAGALPQPGAQIPSKFRSSPLSPDERETVGPQEQTLTSPQVLSPDSIREESDTGLKPAGLKGTPEVITPSRLPQVARVVQQHQDDSEDSEHEQISSALYFPHRQVIPEIAADDLQRQAQSARRPPGSEETVVAQTPPNRPSASEDLISRSPDEVEISLRSQNETKVWHGDLPNVPELTEDEQLTYSSSHASGSETESGTESTQSEYGYGSNTSDNEATPKAKPRADTKQHRQKKDYKEARGAVELKPFNHQVGGHSTVYRFSRRAICKQLNNRENEFYETVERHHPELVQFMPKYIGVLNVTYRKGPKRQKTLAAADKVSEAPATDGSDKAGSTLPPPPSEQNLKARKGSESSPRIVSHSQQQSEQQAETPRVMVENNRHLIPPSLFRSATARPQASGPARSPSLLTQMHRASLDSRSKSDTQFKQDLALRPPIKHHDSWGNTRVNKSLQEQILREVFAAPLIHRHHKHGKTHTSSLTHQSKDAVIAMRRGSSDISGMHSSFSEGTESMHEQILKAKKDHASRRQEEQEEHVPLRMVLTEDSRARADPHEDEVVIRSRALSDQHKKLRRRHSGGGLKRRPLDIDSNRGNLEFHEEEGYGGDREDEVFLMDDDQKAARDVRLTAPQVTPETSGPPALPTIASVSRENSIDPAPELGSPIEDLPVYGPEPLNPKQAQMNLQHDENERVQLFILLEDLTAGMSKPCVLDLKMGTRQYGVEADEKKQKSQRRKCKMTTSRGLGVRVCGMQVWNTKEQHFHFEDKYFGRDLKAGQPFQAALMRFFDDGHGRHDIALKHIPVILEQLRNLEGIIKGLPGYRFYASSLLMIYDRGDSNANSGQHTHHHRHQPHDTGKIRLKIVDFANCVTAEDPLPPTTRCPPQNRDGIDLGYLRGVRSLRMYFQQIWREVKTEMAGSFVQRGEGEGMAVGVGAHGEWGIGSGIAGPGWEDDLGMPSDGNTEVEGDVST